MNADLEAIRRLKTKLRYQIAREWEQWHFFPCYAAVYPQGDPDFRLSDLKEFLISRTDPVIRLATLIMYPLRILRFLKPLQQDGLSLPVPTHGFNVVRFHTFFTDFYFYGAIRKILTQATLNQEEQTFWQGVLTQIISTILANGRTWQLQGKPVTVYQFFPISEIRLNPHSSGARFLKYTNLIKIQPDVDDTFVILEMLADWLNMIEHDNLTVLSDDAQHRQISELLSTPYWDLLRYYQFSHNEKISRWVNYTDVLPKGGICSWFAREIVEAPDLVVNANVLRSILVNADRWKLFKDVRSITLVRGIIEFLTVNTENGIFRTPRGYCFYIPEFYLAMFARLWLQWQRLTAEQQIALDPVGDMNTIREQLLAYLRDEMNPFRLSLNPLDAALALTTMSYLNGLEENFFKKYTEIMLTRYPEDERGYRAYEIFKGKIPTHMVYGSEATTAAFVYEALDEAERWLTHSLTGTQDHEAKSL